MTETTRMTGAEAIVRSLEEIGVTDVFGMPGGAILPTYDPLMDSKIRHILVRHEQGAGHAAEGYAISTGKVGCAIVTSGPAALNTMTALADAHLDSVPIVVITGQVGASLIGTDAFQEADILGASMPITKHSFLVTHAEEIPARIYEAFQIASSGRPGPVLVDITKSAQQDEIDFSWPPETDIPGYRVPLKPSKKQVALAAKAIAEAQAPVLYVGGGVVRGGASEQVAKIVELTDAPVVTTLTARGAFPDSDPHNLGMPGMHGTVAAVGALQRADLLITLGARFDDRVTGQKDTFAPRAKVIHVDIDAAEISKNRYADIPIVGDLKPVLELLNEELETTLTGDRAKELEGWWRYLDRLRDSYPLGWAEPTDGMLAPQYVLTRISALSGPDAFYATGVGQHQMWAAQFLDLEKPRHFISSSGLGTMGFGIPSGMGAQVANPDSVKIILLNNNFLGMVRQWQNLFYGERYSHTDLAHGDEEQVPNFAKLAQAYSIPSRVVKTEEQVDEAIEWALSINDRPVFIDFRVSKDAMVWPMVAAGVSNDDIRYAQGLAPTWDEDE